MSGERGRILPSASLIFVFALCSANCLAAEELKEANVTQIIQDVKLVPSNAAPRPAIVNDKVRRGMAVETGVQSRSELTFKDQTITRLGENTIFSLGEEARSIEVSSGQFLLYVPQNSGGAKVKMGAVTAGITGTTVLGTINSNGTTTFTVLEGSSCIYLEQAGQSLLVLAGQKLTYDPIAKRLEDPVQVDLSQVLTSPLIKDFRTLPSASLIDQEIQIQRVLAAGGGKENAELTRAVGLAGASSIAVATPEQFTAALDSLFTRFGAQQIREYAAVALRARPDLADRLVAAALRARTWGSDEIDFLIREAVGAHPSSTREIVSAAITAAPRLRDSILAAAVQPCATTNALVQPHILNTINSANPQEVSTPGEVVSPEQPPSPRR